MNCLAITYPAKFFSEQVMSDLRRFCYFSLRRLGCAVLFHGLRPSSTWGFQFWHLGLTVQSSRPAFGGRLNTKVTPTLVYASVPSRLASSELDTPAPCDSCQLKKCPFSG